MTVDDNRRTALVAGRVVRRHLLVSGTSPGSSDPSLVPLSNPENIDLGDDLARYLERHAFGWAQHLEQSLVAVENVAAAESAAGDPDFLNGIARLTRTQILAGAVATRVQSGPFSDPLEGLSS